MATGTELNDLVGDRALLGRTSTAERVADILRARIAEGFFAPGARLSEEGIGAALGVSRNTLREAFRLLTHERLLTHQLNRGVFVRVLTAEDVADLYRLRKYIECGVVRGLTGTPDLKAVHAAVAAGEYAAAHADWRDLGTANIHFHQAVAALADSPRTDDLMRGILAELRLVFHVMGDPRRFHEPYLPRNQRIADSLAAGDFATAERQLREYLDDAEAQLVEAYARQAGEGRDPRQDGGRG
ncbi:GntR family transcriptional regulator [Streptomyces capparidis]